MTCGVLYGVGLGPGDPDLLTLKAARLIGAAGVLAYPALEGAPSFARSIVADLIPDTAREIVIELPMRPERGPAQAAYDRGAADIAAVLEAGQDVVCLCEGDPFFYGSFMYLHARLSPRFTVQVVPGITSVSAGAARAGLPLVARDAPLTILPGTLPDAELAARIGTAEAVAILKVGRHLDRIRRVLAGSGLAGRAIYVEHVGLADERVCPLADAPVTAPYFSMIMATRGGDPWL